MIRTPVAWLWLAAGLMGQMGRTPPGDAPRQAKTPEEFDLYISFDETLDPDARYEAATQFERQFPHSELLAYIYESEMAYARSRNESQAAVVSGEKALHLAPGYIQVLIALAEIIPNGTEDPAAVSRAEGYATKALDLIERQRMPRTVTLEDCDTIHRRFRARAHAALGLIAAKRGNIPLAISNLETAVQENPGPDGIQLYRLGKLYALSGRKAAAKAVFERAYRAGPSEVSQLAAKEIDRLLR